MRLLLLDSIEAEDLLKVAFQCAKTNVGGSYRVVPNVVISNVGQPSPIFTRLKVLPVRGSEGHFMKPSHQS